MYEKFFGLAEVPFKILPDARFLWYSEQHKEAKEKIDFHIQQKDGPVYLSADVGLGKTTIAQRIKDELKANKTKKVVYVFAPHLRSQNQFMRFIAGTEGFDIKTARSFQETLTNFEMYLLEQFEKGMTQVLLIDEAQNLPYDALKTIHHLFNFSTPSNSRSRLVRPRRAMSERVSLVHLTNSSVDFEAPLAREGVSNSAHCSG